MITPPVRVHEPGATQRWGTRRRLDWRRELLLAAGLYGIYDLIRAEVSASGAWARRDGYDLLNWEQWAHLDPEHWLNHATLHLAVLTVPACYFYSALYMLLTPGTLIWVYRRHPHAYRQARTTLAMITFAALLAFRWFPTAPPRLLTGAGFADTLVYYKNWGWWGHETSLPSAAHALANQYAAMPSLHVAWATWCAATISVLTVRRSGRLLAWSYPIATALIVMATANHYLLDVLAGAALWLVAHLAVRTAWRRSSQLPLESAAQRAARVPAGSGVVARRPSRHEEQRQRGRPTRPVGGVRGPAPILKVWITLVADRLTGRRFDRHGRGPASEAWRTLPTRSHPGWQCRAARPRGSSA